MSKIRIPSRLLRQFAKHLTEQPDCKHMVFFLTWSGYVLIASRVIKPVEKGNSCMAQPAGVEEHDGWDFTYEGFDDWYNDAVRTHSGEPIIVYADDHENAYKAMLRYNIVVENGFIEWRNEKGQLHSCDNFPARTQATVTLRNSTQEWFQNGARHRIGGPAVTWPDGDKEWYQNDRHHREDGPAVEYASGEKQWFQHGKLHREDGPAREYTNGDKVWYQNGKRHRIDGPACEYANGDKYWYQNGEKHRIDGPAVEYAGGGKLWYLKGNLYSKEDFDEAVKKIPCDIVGKKASCNGKIVEIDGKKYRLMEV